MLAYTEQYTHYINIECNFLFRMAYSQFFLHCDEAVLYVSKHTQKATGFFHLLAVMKLRTFVNVPSERAHK